MHNSRRCDKKKQTANTHRTFTCIAVVPVATRIVSDLDDGKVDKSASVLIVTIWELGEAIGPFMIAPLSEVSGRYGVYNVANVLFISAIVMAIFSQTVPLFIFSRMLNGLVTASNVLNPAIVGDMFPSEQRGAAMSIIMVAPLMGGAIGPLVSGAIVQTSGWHNVLWMSVALAGACEVAFLTCLRETYKVTVLKRKAARLRKETGNQQLRTAFDSTGEDKELKKFWDSIMRPTAVFLSSNVLQGLSLYGSVVFAFFYVMSTTLPDILQDEYHLQPAQTGSVFICFSKLNPILGPSFIDKVLGVGSAICVALCNVYLDKIYIKLRNANNGLGQPEYRLPLVIIGAFALPFVTALYGWIAQTRAPLPLMLLCLVLFGFTVLLGFMPLAVYATDAFGIYSASAMTAIIVTRCLAGTFFPLVATPLIAKFGYGLGFTVLGAVSLALAPIPLLVYKYGSRWRQKCSYTAEAL